MVPLGKADVRCLLEPGAQVSTITETCFNDYFADEERLVDVALVVIGANILREVKDVMPAS